MTLSLIAKFAAGLAAGAIIGAAIGYLGKCSGST